MLVFYPRLILIISAPAPPQGSIRLYPEPVLILLDSRVVPHILKGQASLTFQMKKAVIWMSLTE